MSAGGSGSWDAHDEWVLEALERDLLAGESGGRMPIGGSPPSVSDGRSIAPWPALVASAFLLIVDAAMLAAAVRLGSWLFTVAALALFPFVLAPVIWAGRSGGGHGRSRFR